MKSTMKAAATMATHTFC